MKHLIFLISLLSAATAHAQDLAFSTVHTEACLQEALGPGERLDCIGASANQCMQETVGGETTAGMGGCLDRERDFWDARLNAAYQQLLAQQRGNSTVLDELRGMQRAWITYRDARCGYEYAQWGGGTGGGPAILACLMQATAEQTFILEQNIR